MKFSIIVPSKNDGKIIGKLIQSVINQNKDFELFIMDDSTDDTEKVVSSFNDNRIRFIKSDGVIHQKIEEARLMVTGDIVNVITCDDYYLPETFDKVEKTIGKNNWLCGAIQEENRNILVPTISKIFTPGCFYTKKFMDKNNLRYEWEEYPNIADTVFYKKAKEICDPIILKYVILIIGIRRKSPIYINKIERYLEMKKLRGLVNSY